MHIELISSFDMSQFKEPLVFTKEFNQKVTGMSGKFKFGQKRQFADINEGYKAGYDVKPEMMDPAKLLGVYTKAVSRALVTREHKTFKKLRY